jgi:hypothetical protein
MANGPAPCDLAGGGSITKRVILVDKKRKGLALRQAFPFSAAKEITMDATVCTVALSVRHREESCYFLKSSGASSFSYESPLPFFVYSDLSS